MMDAEGIENQTTPEPAIDVEAEAERQAEERYQSRLEEIQQHHEADKRQAVDSALEEARQQEAAARRELKDLETQTGKTPSQLLESFVEAEIERLMDVELMTPSAARQYVEAQQQINLHKAREAERESAAREAQVKNSYRAQKLAFLGDPKQSDIYKKALEKFGAEVDQFSGHGKIVAFDVALKYIAGQHLPEIAAEVSKEVKDAKAKAGTATAKAKAAAQGGGFEDDLRALAVQFDLDPDRIVKHHTGRAATRKPADTGGLTQIEVETAAAFGYSPAEYLRLKAKS